MVMNPLARRPVTRPAQLLAVAIALVATWLLILSAGRPRGHQPSAKASFPRPALRSSSQGSAASPGTSTPPPTGSS